VTETIEYKLTGGERYCPDCGTKYKVVTKEVVKRLKFIPSTFEVVEEVTYVYSCPKCGAMIRPEKELPLIVAHSHRTGGSFGCRLFNSLLLYLLNGYFLVVSRTFLVQVLACTNPFVIVIGNMVFDLAGTFLLAKYVLMRPKVLRVLCGEAYLLREENL